VKIKAWLITLVVLSSVLFGLYTYKNNAISSGAQSSDQGFEPAATVEAVKTAITPFQSTTQVTGNIRAPQQLTLKNELAGKITELRLQAGVVVKKDQVLLRLDTSNEVAALGAAKARLTLTEQTLKRYKKLVSRNEISADLVDKASSEREIAISDIELLQTKINKKTIKAPFKSIVGLHNLTIGQYLDGNSSITELVGVDATLWVEFALPQSLPELAIGEIVTLTVNNSLSAPAKIIVVDPVLASQSRHLKYRAEFNKSAMPIKPNGLVDVVAPISKEEGRISIPDLALTHDQFGDYVFVLTPEDSAQGSYRAKRVQVWLERKINDRVILKKGLNAGQLIATTGAFKLREGMKVFLAQPKPE
jgi:membrane fusion protein (multidrug efflux system)